MKHLAQIWILQRLQMVYLTKPATALSPEARSYHQITGYRTKRDVLPKSATSSTETNQVPAHRT